MYNVHVHATLWRKGSLVPRLTDFFLKSVSLGTRLGGGCVYIHAQLFTNIYMYLVCGMYKGDGKSGNEDIIHHDMMYTRTYHIHVCTYIRSVQIFTIFVNESENLSLHCFTTCIRPTAISSWTPKAIKNIVTLILTHAATQCALNRKFS